MAAAQMNVVEFHTWSAVKSAIVRPDRLILDLDPGEGVPWATVRQGAQLVRVRRVAQDPRRKGATCHGAAAQAI
ncbi:MULTISPECIES: non-homologous end-joining DNA ligase LigD [Achromobacter]|uniref:non-homologous end-joining DNA ligase LigD n=2 Tax=Achromobacter TaxID=222 RepID=UPI0030B7F81F